MLRMVARGVELSENGAVVDTWKRTPDGPGITAMPLRVMPVVICIYVLGTVTDSAGGLVGAVD